MSPPARASGTEPSRAPLLVSPWPDLLHRRIAMQANRLGGLALAPDGRIAISAGTRVSVLHAVTAVASGSHLSASPVDTLRAMLDTSAREARAMRPPLVGHALVYEAVAHAPPVAALAWAPAPDTAILLLASPLRRIAPTSHSGVVTEFSNVRLWKTLRARENGTASEVGRSELSVKLKLKLRPSQPGKKENVVGSNSSPRPVKCAEFSVKLKLPLCPPQSGKGERVIRASSSLVPVKCKEFSVKLKLPLRPPQLGNKESIVPSNSFPRPVKRKLRSRLCLEHKQEEGIATATNGQQKSIPQNASTLRRRSRRTPKVKRLIDFEQLESSSEDVKPSISPKLKKRRKGQKEAAKKDSILVPTQTAKGCSKRRVSQKLHEEDSEYVPNSGDERNMKSVVEKRKRNRKKSGPARKRQDDDSDFILSSDEEPEDDFDEDDVANAPRLSVPLPRQARRAPRSCTMSKLSTGPVKPPSDPILCMEFVTVCAAGTHGAAVLDSDFLVKSARFLLYGTKNGAFVQRWRHPHTALGQKHQLSEGWASSVAVVSPVDAVYSPSSKVAIGGPFGEVHVLSLTWNPGEDDADNLNVVVLWKAPTGIFHGPVNSFCFGLYTRNSQYIYLAMAVGNCVAAVRIVDVAPGASNAGKPRKTQVCLQGNAHYQVVTSVAWLPDGTVFSASADGSMSLWELWWDADKKPCSLISILQDQSADLNSVMGARRSENGLLVVALSSRPKAAGEIGEPAVRIKRKYGSAARSSLLSILAYPGNHNYVRICLESAVARLMDSAKYAVSPVSLWDVQIWVLSDTRRPPVAEVVLREQLDMLISFVDTEGVPAVATRIRKVALCVASVLQKVIENSPEEVNKVRTIRTRLRISLLAFSYFEALERFAEIPSSKLTETISPEDQEALEAMYSFVTLNRSLLDKKIGFETTLEEVHRRLAETWPSSTTGKLSNCPVCMPPFEGPLVADADQPEAFFCASGDCFPRCVKTALPCTDAVPLICTGCESRARCRGIVSCCGSVSDLEPFDKNCIICPLCNCPLLPSTM